MRKRRAFHLGMSVYFYIVILYFSILWLIFPSLLKGSIKRLNSKKEDVQEGNFLAVYWQDEEDQEVWYLGRVSRVGKCRKKESDKRHGPRHRIR